jgi:hypothetical protein
MQRGYKGELIIKSHKCDPRIFPRERKANPKKKKKTQQQGSVSHCVALTFTLLKSGYLNAKEES